MAMPTTNNQLPTANCQLLLATGNTCYRLKAMLFWPKLVYSRAIIKCENVQNVVKANMRIF